MDNDQGRRHHRKKRKRSKTNVINETVAHQLSFIETDDYVWENHVIGRLPFREPEEVEIVFHNDKLWQED